MEKITIAIDAMGGDYGPSVTVPAVIKALDKHPELSLILVGDEAVLLKALKSRKRAPGPNLSIVHASQKVEMDELPSQALRNKKDSSMRVAINLVKNGEAQACVSAGNTGALMATARFVLKTIQGIDRPAIATKLPTTSPTRDVWMLDLGANVDSDAEQLFQFAIMGSVVANAVDNIESPKVALLNIGAEEIKGNEQVKQTAQLLLSHGGVNYTGYIEADDIFRGVADVVVCDGFVGNVALKAIEGTASLISHYLKKAFGKNSWTKFVGLLTLPVLNAIKKRVDPERYNGATLIGLQGIVVKSHGGARPAAFTYAIEEAVMQVKQDILLRLHEKLQQLLEKP